MDENMDKQSLFLSPVNSDFVIIIGNEKLNVHKTVLMSSSEYFSALFNSEMIETKTKEITLKETLIKPFIIVLKHTYGVVMAEEEWISIKIQELFESIITANKYQFVECEKFLSNKMIDIFTYKITNTDSEGFNDNKTSDNTFVTIWELLEMAKLHNLMFLIEYCLNFFDENISYVFKTFEKQTVSADVLLDVIKRDTFGAQEIEIFNVVHEWIKKNRIRNNLKCIEETILLETVRLNLISLEQLKSIVVKSGLYEYDFIDNAIKHEFDGIISQNSRICYEKGKLFTTDYMVETHLRTEDKVTVCVTCILPMLTKINHIIFTIRPHSCDDNYLKFNSNYWIGIPDNNAENGFRKILDYNQYSCIGEQEHYFDEPFVTKSIRISLESNFDLININDSPMRRTFRDPKIVNINSLSYEYSKNSVKTIDQCLVPDRNVGKRFGTDCYSPYFGDQFNVYLNDIMLNKSTHSFRIYRNFDAEKIFKIRINEPIVGFDGQSPPYYLIRLPQPMFVDCLQFELILEKDNQTTDEVIAAECKVEYCSAYIRDIGSAEWSTLSEDPYLTQSGFHNLEFDLRKILVIRISGIRYDISHTDRCTGRSFAYPLNIKNFSIPADRNSVGWSYGTKLGNG